MQSPHNTGGDSLCSGDALCEIVDRRTLGHFTLRSDHQRGSPSRACFGAAAKFREHGMW
ncbi:hypothetical protein GFS60_06010 [Rhodococcus sp. WAY2]|nr:hypothetical protein GFS60_06010 [Rhodococcus sp. WAY2]